MAPKSNGSQPENPRLSSNLKDWLTSHYWEILDSIRFNNGLTLPATLSRKPDTVRQVRWAVLAATSEAMAQKYYRKYTKDYDVRVTRVIELHDFICSFPPEIPIQSVMSAYRMRFSNLEFRRSIRQLGFTLDGSASSVSAEIKGYQKLAQIIQRLAAHGIDINTETVLCAVDASGKPLNMKQLQKFRKTISDYLSLRSIAHPLELAEQ